MAFGAPPERLNNMTGEQLAALTLMRDAFCKVVEAEDYAMPVMNLEPFIEIGTKLTVTEEVKALRFKALRFGAFEGDHSN